MNSSASAVALEQLVDQLSARVDPSGDEATKITLDQNVAPCLYEGGHTDIALEQELYRQLCDRLKLRGINMRKYQVCESSDGKKVTIQVFPRQ